MLHPYLERQIKKHLGDIDLKDERLMKLLQAVSNSYANYERDRELSEHAFSVNEKEYQILNSNLKELTQKLEKRVFERTKELSDLAQFPMENPNPIFRVDMDGKIIFRNPVAKKIKKVFMSDGVLFNIDDFFIRYMPLISSNQGSFEMNTEQVQYLFYYKKIEEKHYINFYGADVTERNYLRTEAVENFKRLNNFLESTKDVYYIIHAKNKAKNFITSSWADFYGFSPEKCKDIIAERRKNITAQTRAAYNEAFQKLDIGAKTTVRYQIKNRSNGQEFWVMETVTKHYDNELNDTVISGRITDITNEYIYQNQLKESEERFRNLIEHVPVMSWVSNEKNIVTYSNKAYKDFFGISLEKLKGPEAFSKYVHPEDYKKAIVDWQKNIKNQKPILAEYRIKDAKGNFHNILEKAVPRFLSDGKFAGYIGAIFDLTNEKVYQQQLREEKEKQELLTLNSPDIVMLTDNEGRIEYVSPTAQRILGYKESEMINRSVQQFICKDSFNHLSAISWLKKTGNSNSKYEYQMQTKGGQKLWVSSILSVIDADKGKKSRILMHNRDISSYKTAQNALLESEQKYRSIFENMELGVMEVDTKDQIQWVNKSFEYMTGYKKKDLIGKNAFDVFLSSSLSRKTMQEIIKQRIKREDSIYEVKMKKQNGDFADVVISGSPVLDLEGNVRGSVGVHWDVTGIRKMEKMIEQEKVLRQKEVMKATLNAEERQREILGNELHDGVGQILTYTTLFLNMAANSDKLDPSLFTKAQNKVTEALNEVRRISRSLVPPALLDLGLKEAIVELINQFAEIKQIKFAVDCKSEDFYDIEFNAKRTIYRIVQELVNNALKHAQAKNIKLSFRRNKHNLVIKCVDNGVGFNVEKVKKGVGLKSITNRAFFYGGVANINSVIKKGTQFTVELPLSNILEESIRQQAEN